MRIPHLSSELPVLVKVASFISDAASAVAKYTPVPLTATAFTVAVCCKEERRTMEPELLTSKLYSSAKEGSRVAPTNRRFPFNAMDVARLEPGRSYVAFKAGAAGTVIS
jgi:hypothetical protein